MYSEGLKQDSALQYMAVVQQVLTERFEAVEQPQQVNIVMPKLPSRKKLIEDILDEVDDSDTDADGSIEKPKEPIKDDEGWAKTVEQNSKEPVMTLSHVRKLRLIREKNRKELIKRMLLLQQMYAAPAEPGGMGF